MTRFRIASSSSTLFAAIAAALVTAGCATGPKPKALQDASMMLAHNEVAALEAVSPDIVKEAKGHLRKAQEAYEDGDEELAELYANLATLRLETARNLAVARATRRQAKSMAGQGSGFGDEESQLRTRQAELRRFDQLEARIARLQADLSRKPEGDSPDVLSAKQALAKARRMQAEAIGAGATGTDEYRQGSSLIGSAVESLELGIYADSRTASSQALTAFQAAIEKARSPQAQPGPAVDPMARDRAEDAVAEAAAAQATALAAGAPQSNPALYQRGMALLGSAERRLDRDDFPGATRQAQEAKQAFTQSMGMPGAERSGLGPLPAGGPGYGKSLDDWLVELRMKRAEMLGASKDASCPAAFKEFEAVLQLAEERRNAGDQRRALELAIRADERLRRCELAAAIGPAGPSEAQIAEGIAKRRASDALRDVQGELAKAQARWPGDARLSQPQALVANAERWFDRGDYGQAERLADQARISLVTILATPATEKSVVESALDPAKAEAGELIERAQSLHARVSTKLGDDPRLREPTRNLKEAERAYDASRYDQAKRSARTAIEELAKLEAAGPATAEKPDKPLSPAAQKAADAIEQARDAKVRAEIALVAQTKLEEPNRLLRQAQESFDGGKYDPARLYAEKAKEQYVKLATAAGAPPPTTAADPTLTCARARERVDAAERLARRTDGKHLNAADKAEHERGSALVTVSRIRLRERECDSALGMADEAVSILQPLPVAPAAGQGAAKKPDKPGTTPAKPDKPGPGAKKPGTGEPGAPPVAKTEPEWQQAYDELQLALRARDAARKGLTDTMKPTFDRGVARLAQGREAYQDKRYDEAAGHAKAARGQFNAVLAVAGEPQVADRPKKPKAASADEGAAPKTTKKPKAKPDGKTPPTAKGDGKKPKQPKPPARPAWEGPYRWVFKALALRDKAAELANVDAEKEALDRGKKMLDQAQEAWKKKNYVAAGEHAKLAIEELQPIVDGSLEPAEDPVETMRKADAALREAKVVMQICERDKCEERDLAEFTRGKEMLKSADESFDGKNYAYAEELAHKAKDKLSEILAKPRPNLPKTTVDPAQKQAANDALAEAEISRKLCEARSCSAIDLEAWLRAQQSHAAAKSAVADEQFERAARLGKQVKEAYDAIKRAEPSKPTFAISPDIATVTRSGSQLYLKPPVDFRTGSANLEGASKEVVADLARVLIANQAVLQSVRVLGFTDNRGNATINKNISAKRAEAVRKALQQAGVPAALLSSEGRGAADPIADNTTDEGRQANRRVEVHFETKP